MGQYDTNTFKLKNNQTAQDASAVPAITNCDTAAITAYNGVIQVLIPRQMVFDRYYSLALSIRPDKETPFYVPCLCAC